LFLHYYSHKNTRFVANISSLVNKKKDWPTIANPEHSSFVISAEAAFLLPKLGYIITGIQPL
jgi:hypothetical protein